MCQTPKTSDTPTKRRPKRRISLALSRTVKPQLYVSCNTAGGDAMFRLFADGNVEDGQMIPKVGMMGKPLWRCVVS